MRAIRLALVLCGVVMAAPAAGADGPAPAIEVRRDNGLYQVAARFTFAGPPPVARAVLTDYAGIPRFIPDVTRSVIRARHDARVIVEQEAVASVMLFSKRVQLLLEIEEGEDRLRFRDVSGRSFAHYEGEWRLAADGTGTAVTYRLSAKPAFAVPEFLVTRLLRRDARNLIDGLRAEVAARTHAGGQTGGSQPRP